MKLMDATPPPQPQPTPPQPEPEPEPQLIPPQPSLGQTPPVPPNNPSSTDNQWAVAFHLSPLLGFMFPFANLIAPLVLWLIKKTDSPALDATGKNVLNFQISITIYAVISFLAMLVFIGFLMIIGVLVLWLYGMINGAIKAGNGESFQAPMTIQFLK